MDLFNPKASIDIIIGPMFSGKTTELIRRLSICADAGLRVLYINSTLDNRAELCSTHNSSLRCKESIKMMKSADISSCMSLVKDFDVIGIDEAQFFDDLKACIVVITEEFNKKVIVSGLNGNFMREPFGQINEIISLCDNITKLYPFCLRCCKEYGKITPALFSKRIVNETNDVICVGADDKYIPVCRGCYLIKESLD